MKEKNIFVEGDRLYTGRREVYQLNRPLTGATNGAEYQTIASGKASSSFFHAERALATPFELDEYNQYTSLINFVNMVKNAISWVDMNVYIESSQEGATRARVTVQFHSNISIDAFDTGLYDVSSTLVRQYINEGKDITRLIPSEITALAQQYYKGDAKGK